MLVAKTLIEFLLLRLDALAGSVVGADQEVADDPALIVAQRRDRYNRREAAAVLANVGELVDIFDSARGLENQRIETGRNRRAQFHAESVGAGNQLLRVGNIGRRDLVENVGSRIPEHPLGADIEQLDDTLVVGGDAREVGAVEDGVLQRAGLEERFLPAHLGARVSGQGVECLGQRRPYVCWLSMAVRRRDCLSWFAQRAETWSFTVCGSSFRSRSRCA